MKQNILKLVMETCVDMIGSNDAFKKQIIEQANMFASQPLNRTADVIPSIQLLTAQLVGLSMLPIDQQEIHNMDPQSTTEHCKINFNFTDFARAATEEILRRSMKKDAQSLTKD